VEANGVEYRVIYQYIVPKYQLTRRLKRRGEVKEIIFPVLKIESNYRSKIMSGGISKDGEEK
jgi:hypothetical protein